MDIRQCRRCRKLYQFRGNYTCPSCVNELDDFFVKVREFIYSNPSANIQRICEETGADEEDVLGWLREGRLILNDDNAALLSCETCGAPIRTGRFCDGCKNHMRSNLESGARALRGPDTSPMGPRPPASRDGDLGRRMHINVDKKK